jgi:predicted nucleic acid-binding protein
VPRFYLDSSAMVKRYSREPGTAGVVAVYRSAYVGRSVLCFSEWNVGEALGVLQRKARISSRPRTPPASTDCTGRSRRSPASDPLRLRS